ncbi:polysaccharide lyase family 14 protein [Rhizoctonia solani]|uniref:Polysaccharide lyase family 14 protein n=1 Tax=Rhizoctonia solani TaxID=456999 RepID=A0A0K6FRW1_9AGAM|nr:polysaccharide lyase family 14 protein [Rhizoctonia solani]
MHFKTIVLAGLSSLAAVAALPSRMSGSHEAHIMPRHHRNVRARKVEPGHSKVKRCATSSSAEPEEIQPTGVYAGNAAKTTKASTSTISASEPVETETKSTKSSTQSSTKTSSVEASLPTGGTGGIAIGDKLTALFPDGVSSKGSSWSTNPAFSNSIALSDESLRATKMMARLSHPVVEKEGKKAMQISFARGSYAYRGNAAGGVSFYALGPASQPITDAKVLTFSYALFFEDGFKFNKGGKLPGLYGGVSNEEATGCSGGRRSDKCWSTRFMWRANGAAEVYTYLPPSAESANKKAVCSGSDDHCTGDYGWSLGRGVWNWKVGAWQTIAQKVTLNTPGKSDGSIIVYLDGVVVHQLDNIVIRTSGNSVPQGAMVQSFFGGHDATWASPQDQKLWFSDFSMAVLE